MRELKANNVLLDLSDSIPIPITFSIADVKEPNKRKRNFSKEVVLPDTNVNRAFFISSYNLTVSEENIQFDPTAKTDCKYTVRGVSLLKNALLKLNKVVRKDRALEFHVQIFSESVDVYLLLQQFSIRDLDWSAYTHALTQANIVASWTAATGSGYYYPLIEYKTTRPSATTWRTTDFVPYVYLKEILEKMHEELGITFTSTTFDTTLFKSILIGHGGGAIKALSPADIDQRMVDVDTGALTYDEDAWPQAENGWIDTTTIPWQYGQTAWVANMPQRSVADLLTYAEVQDDLGQMNSGEITIARKGRYKFALTMVLDYVWDFGSLTPTTWMFGGLVIYKNGVQFQLTEFGTVTPATSTTGTVDFSHSRNIDLKPGDVISYEIKSSLARFEYDPGTPANVVNLTMTENSEIILQMTSLDTDITDGSTIEIERMIPDMKCSDALLGATRHFNLYTTEVSEDNEVESEPLSDYYLPTSQFDDISLDVDYAMDFIIKPTANDFAKSIKFTFKESKDWEFQRYLESWGERYGDRTVDNPSYYAKGELKFDLPWGTIAPFEIASGILVPRFITYDQNGNAKQQTGPPRICLRNGSKTGAWTLTDDDGSNASAKATYPCVHHFDDWEDPAFDLNFDLVEEVYYTATVVTTTNSYTEYHGEFINEMISPAGQLIECFVKWDNITVKNKDFAKLQMINGALFRLNEIKDFDADARATNPIELIKVLKAKKPKVTQITYGDPVAPNPDGSPIKFKPVTLIDDVYTADPNELVIVATAGTFDLTLPPATGNDGQTYWIKNSGSGLVTVVPDGTEKIDGGSSITLRTTDGVHIIAVNDNWIIN